MCNETPERRQVAVRFPALVSHSAVVKIIPRFSILCPETFILWLFSCRGRKEQQGHSFFNIHSFTSFFRNQNTNGTHSFFVGNVARPVIFLTNTTRRDRSPLIRPPCTIRTILRQEHQPLAPGAVRSTSQIPTACCPWEASSVKRVGSLIEFVSQLTPGNSIWPEEEPKNCCKQTL